MRTRVSALLRRRPSRIRMRLTALYSALFALSGTVLLGITYLLVSNAPRTLYVFQHEAPGGGVVNGPVPGGASPPPEAAGDLARQMESAGTAQHDALLHRLLVDSGIALAITALIAVVLGWIVAGRILRPLRTMTDRIQTISARNVHERLAAAGPADEIKNLSDTVDGLLERLDTALGAQRRVVANAAHELRTPLTLERALLEETLMDRDAGLDTYRTTFDRLLQLSRNQGRLLDSLLTLASSERGLEEREPVDLALAAEQVLLDVEPDLARLGLRIVGSLAPAGTTGHPALAERLVGNLVENAIEYNVPDGWIEVSTSTRESRAVVVVENSGPTVSADRVAGLFEPFQRLDRSSNHEKHHGLGLSIVRAIAAGHDAVVDAGAGREGGLRIEISFPSGAVTAAGEAPAAVTVAPV